LTENQVTWSKYFQVLQLGVDGQFMDPYRNGQSVPWTKLSQFFQRAIRVPRNATDIFIWVHGWRNEKIAQASRIADLVMGEAERLYTAQPGNYPRLRGFRATYILVNWPSASRSSYRGYARIRERAHQMTEHGHASRVLAFLLSYLDQQRVRPGGRNVLQMPGGQYLHCVGHSFGGRFLAQAVIDAANPVTATLPLLPANPQYPFTVDNLLLFQMAAPPDIFGGRLRPLLDDAPLQGPVCLTFSRHDQATCLLHKLAEGRRGIGCVGASAPADMVKTISMRPADSPYPAADLQARIVNVDASRSYTRRMPPSGAHSDLGHPESAHLLLTLADFAR
jgi:hypothetical protein